MTLTPDTARNAALREAPERAGLFSAVDAIIGDTRSRALCYAMGYTRRLDAMLRNQAPDNALTIQARYILSNITHWRHPDAPAVRSALRAWINTK